MMSSSKVGMSPSSDFSGFLSSVSLRILSAMAGPSRVGSFFSFWKRSNFSFDSCGATGGGVGAGFS